MDQAMRNYLEANATEYRVWRYDNDRKSGANGDKHPGLGPFLREYKKFSGREIDAEEMRLVLSVVVSFDILTKGAKQ